MSDAARILHVINTLEVGGGAEHVLQLARGLARHGFQTTVLAGVDGPASGRLRELGAAVEILGALRLGAPWRLAASFRRLRPDLVHLHGSRSGLLGALGARLAGVRPVFYTAHMLAFRRRLPPPFPWLAARAESLTCRLSDRVIFVSASDRDEAARRGLPVGAATVVPNGIDVGRFPAAEDRRQALGLSPDAPVVGMISRLVPQKDPLAFVRMAARVASHAPEARFLLVGDGPLRGAVESAAREPIDRGRMILIGFRPDVPELLATMDVVVFPSLWEAQGIALIEAMAASRAVVATRLPAHAEAVVDGENGLMVEPGDADGMAAAVQTLLEDAGRRESLARRARETVASRYRIEDMVERTVQLYRAALATSRPALHSA